MQENSEKLIPPPPLKHAKAESSGAQAKVLPEPEAKPHTPLAYRVFHSRPKTQRKPLFNYDLLTLLFFFLAALAFLLLGILNFSTFKLGILFSFILLLNLVLLLRYHLVMGELVELEVSPQRVKVRFLPFHFKISWKDFNEVSLYRELVYKIGSLVKKSGLEMRYARIKVTFKGSAFFNQLNFTQVEEWENLERFITDLKTRTGIFPTEESSE